MSQSLFRSALQIYQDEGLVELGKRAGKKFVFDPIVYRSLYNRLADKSLTNNNLIQYAKENGNIYDFSSESSKIDVPPHLTEAIDHSPRITCIVPNAEIVGNRGLILTEENQPVLESVKNSEHYLDQAIKSMAFQLFQNSVNITKKSTSDYEIAISMIMHTSREHHYGHWLVEYLPILYHLHNFEKKTGIEPEILINNDPPEWMVKSFEFFGYNSSRLNEFDYGKAQIDKLLVPLRGSTGDTADKIQFSPIELQWVRDTITSEINNSSNETSQRIFVSRQGLSRARKVGNFGEVKRILQKYDFEIVHPEELTIKRQVEKFSNAEIIVGGYGSGLHNVIFAKKAHLIELLQEEYTPYDVNEALAIALGHSYSSVIGNRVQIEDENTLDTKAKNLPYNVPVRELEDNIQTVLTSKSN